MSILCWLGFHDLRGEKVPHTYRCARDRRVWWMQDRVDDETGETIKGGYIGPGTSLPVYRRCHAIDAGYP